MDTATELAIRAIVRALYHSEAISAAQVQAIMSALKDAAAALRISETPTRQRN